MSSLDATLIRRLLSERTSAQLDDLECFASIASTNTYLLEQAPPKAEQFRVAIADHQTAGRGRHHRRWVSPAGTGLCMSLAYTFDEQPEQLSSLTLAIGIGVVDALRQLQIEGVSLKWPNDFGSRSPTTRLRVAVDMIDTGYLRQAPDCVCHWHTRSMSSPTNCRV